MSTLDFSVEVKDDGLAVLWMRGKADIEAHDRLKKEFATVRGMPEKRVVLDLRMLDFLTSLTLGEMLQLSKAKKAAGGKVVIAGPTEFVGKVFAQAKVGKVIPIFATVEEAVASCAA